MMGLVIDISPFEMYILVKLDKDMADGKMISMISV